MVIEEKDLTGEKLTEEVEKLLADRAGLDKMGDNARAMCVRDAAKRRYDCPCKVGGSQNNSFSHMMARSY